MLLVDAVILQKIEIDYKAWDENDQPINISNYTGNACMWHTDPVYREAWFIRNGQIGPTYLVNSKVPSFDANAKIDDEFDDESRTIENTRAHEARFIG